MVENLLKTPKQNGKMVLLVYFIGGMTYAEISSLRYLSNKFGKIG